MSRYTRTGSGLTSQGEPWQVGVAGERLVIMQGRLTISVEGAERGKFTKAVAVAGTSTAAHILSSAPSIKCAEVVGDEDDEEGLHECGKMSRYLVERSDGDKTFGENGGSSEACEQHLADVVLGMVDGDGNVRAIVNIRWTTS